ncbi:hypothetical protein HU200_064973 [Digitaria exilis]|uniref:Glycosyltransferase n=1 Tax=Digitaria exilis TaxID=1010633 RepID=A0A835A901_9POAL|nr:hypothetical protein HU200_064973 [Digitaria exilis]
MEVPAPPPPQPHFLFVTNPMQGHINPTRRLAARVMASNPCARVTFSTAVSGHRRMFPSLSRPDDEAIDAAGVLHAPFSDGFDDGFSSTTHDAGTYRARAFAAGRDTLSAVASRLAARGHPVTRVVYTFLVPWVPDVACAHGVPASLFWIQPAAVFAVYYRYFHGHDADLAACANGIGGDTVSLPGMPPLKREALPSVVSITSPEHRHYLLLDLLRDLFLSLDEHKPRVLVNTFDDLEHDALRAVPEFELAAVGPVVPDEDGGSSPTSADLLHPEEQNARDTYMAWLDTKPARSVVYVSFGSVLSLNNRQEEEMRQGLEATGRPYLWVARKAAAGDGSASPDGCAEGMVVEWCDQARVLSHAAVGCFVTHCGWNSTLESVARGVPLVAVPQWTDQPTVAWLVEERMGAGVRARVDGEGVIERGELRRCVEAVMGDGEVPTAIRAQSDRWRELASEAVAPGGTSERNLRAFASAAAVSSEYPVGGRVRRRGLLYLHI